MFGFDAATVDESRAGEAGDAFRRRCCIVE